MRRGAASSAAGRIGHASSLNVRREAIQVDVLYTDEYPTKSAPYLAIIGRFQWLITYHRLAPHSDKDVAGVILARQIQVSGHHRRALTARGSRMRGPEWGDMGYTWDILSIAHPTQASSQGGPHERDIGLIKKAIQVVTPCDHHTDIHRAMINACNGGNIRPLIPTCPTPMAVVFDRHSVLGFPHQHQFVT